LLDSLLQEITLNSYNVEEGLNNHFTILTNSSI